LAAVVLEGQSIPQVDAAPTATIIEMGLPRRWIQAFSYSIPSGEPQLTLVVLRDITELRRTEAVRRDFVANVSHDLRTPIASLKALVETLLDGALDDQTVARDFLSRMAVEVDDLVRLVEQLLQLSRVEAGQLELRKSPGSVGDVIQRVAERMQAQAALKEVEIVVDVPPDLPSAEFDAERIEQVLVNLVQNAITFSPQRGRTTLSATGGDDEIVVAVADRGPGLDPSDVERVFERFYKADRSRAASGSGLGLAIAKHMIQLHGGRIWVENDFGRGATFKFSLPRALS
ncbi:MAG TPA: ATP-binding protein, partial [Nitrolancea sp.]|nr:ATP-binding protein [Nitrolancea sp.]